MLKLFLSTNQCFCHSCLSPAKLSWEVPWQSVICKFFISIYTYTFRAFQEWLWTILNWKVLTKQMDSFLWFSNVPIDEDSSCVLAYSAFSCYKYQGGLHWSGVSIQGTVLPHEDNISHETGCCFFQCILEYPDVLSFFDTSHGFFEEETTMDLEFLE